VLLLIPLGPDAEGPRLPRVVGLLIALNALAFVATSTTDHAKVAAEEAELERVAEWTLRQAGRARPALAERRAGSPTALAFLLRDAAWPDEIEDQTARERLQLCRDDYRRLRAEHVFHRFGFVPADVGPVRLAAHLFLHADLPHLLFNMVFLWAVGGLLELTWGPLVFGAFYVASGVAAAIVHALANPGSLEPAVGASGAVAGLMGAFAVGHARTPMRLALVSMMTLAPRVTFLTWPAWIFLGLWALEQVFFAALTAHMDSGIAFGAHLGGFAFGAAAGLLVARYVRRPPLDV
jgi:membrane associated rhomboid family serine protease